MIQVENCQLLLSCCNQNGGLYLLDFKDKQYDLIKILDVECRGIVKYGKYFLVVSNSEGIFILDDKLKIIKQKTSHKGLDYHGAAIKNDMAFIVETGTNSIGVYDLRKDLLKIDEIRFSPNKITDVCHVNDLFIVDDSLFVSMFSYPNHSADGGVIIEYSLKDRKIINFIYEKLSQPHSVLFHNNHLYYCNSVKFTVHQNDKEIFKSLGYTRGLAIHKQTMFIGQSESRHLDKLLQDHTNILFECGIYVHNLTTKLSSFISLPSSEVYGILII